MLGSEISQSLRAKLLCELMEYQYSKRKHIEVSGEEGGQLRLIVELAYVRPGELPPLEALPPEPGYPALDEPARRHVAKN